MRKVQEHRTSIFFLMISTQQCNGWSSLHLFVAFTTILTITTHTTLAEEGTTTSSFHSVNGCEMVQAAAAAGKDDVSVVANTSMGDTTPIQIVFENCVLPQNMNIKIVIVHNAAQRETTTTTTGMRTVFLTFQNVSMNGGSLMIISSSPVDTNHDENTSPRPLSYFGFTQVRLLVADTVMHSSQDLFVVDTTTWVPKTNNRAVAVSDISMEFTSSTFLSSTKGRVASVVADAVQNMHILVRNSTVLRTKGSLAASVVTTKIVNCSLIANTETGPVIIEAGDTNVKQVGALSILHSSTAITSNGQRRSLEVDNVRILVTDNTSSSSVRAADVPTTTDPTAPSERAGALAISAKSKSMSLACSIGVTNPDDAALRLHGFVAIDVHLQQLLGSRMSSIISIASETAAAAAGIVVVANDLDRSSTSLLELNNCSLTLSFNKRGQFHSASHVDAVKGRVNVSSTVEEDYAASSVLGIAMNAVSKGVSTTTVLLANQSRVMITSSSVQHSVLSPSKPISALGSRARHGYVAASTLGIALNSYCASKETSFVRLNIVEASHVVVAAVLFPSTVVESVATTGAASTLGVVLSTRSHHRDGIAKIALADASTVSISTVGELTFNNVPTDSIQLESSSGSSGSAAGTLGISVNSVGIKEFDAAATVFVSTQSTVNLSASIYPPSTTHTSRSPSVIVSATCRGNIASCAAMGVAVESSVMGTPKKTGTKNLELDGTLSINGLVGKSVAMKTVVSDATDAATATLGIALWDENKANFDVGAKAFLDVWVGAADLGTLRVGNGESRTLAGISVTGKNKGNIIGLRSEITDLACCFATSSSTTPPPGLIKPSQPGIVFSKLSTLNDADSQCYAKAGRVTNHSATSVDRAMTYDSWPWLWGRGEMAVVIPPTKSITPSHATTSDTISLTSSMSLSLSVSQPASTTNSLSPSVSPSPSVPLSDTQTMEQTVSNLETQSITHSTSVELPPPSPPPSSERKRRVGVALAGSETTGTVVVSAAGGANALVSTLGSGGAGVVVVAGSAVRMMDCGLSEDDARPARYELPIQFSLGSSKMQYFAGAVVGHTALQCVLFMLPLVLRQRQQKRIEDAQDKEKSGNNVVQYLSMLFCGSYGFFTGTILGGCMTVMVHYEGDTMTLAVGVVCAVVILALHVAIMGAVHVAPRKGLITQPVPSLDGAAVKLKFVLADDPNSASQATGCFFSAGSHSRYLVDAIRWLTVF